MADYQKMYTQLFNDVTDAIRLLQEAQRRAEEIYIAADDVPISIVGEEIERHDDEDN